MSSTPSLSVFVPNVYTHQYIALQGTFSSVPQKCSEHFIFTFSFSGLAVGYIEMS